MMSLPRLRTLLGATLCWAPVLMAAGARADDGAAAMPAQPASASPTASPSGSAFSSFPATTSLDTTIVVTPCLFSASFAPDTLLAANAPPTRATGKSVQQIKRPSSFHITGPITTSSDRLQSGANGIVNLTGNVDVRMGDRELQADQMTYDQRNNSMTVNGQVHYLDPNVRVQGTSGHYGDEGAQFSDAQFQFLKLPGRGSAADISMDPNNVVTLRRVTYTSCPKQHADWDLQAKELRLDTDAGRGVGRGARVDFEGIPILYLPYISFPLSTQRQSGFLFPQLGSSSRSGVIFGVPWYWNIAPNQDATFTPTGYTSRGVNMGVEYRFLSRDTDGTLNADYMPHDARYGAERSYLRLIDRLELPANTRVQTDLEGVSDSEYFEDFSLGAQSTSTPFLPRHVAVTHRDEVWDLRAEGLGFQTLAETLPVNERPYVQMPRLSAAALWSPSTLPDLKLGFTSEAIDFSRSSCMLYSCLVATDGSLINFPLGVGVSGWRLDAQPTAGFDISGPGYFFRPNAVWEFTEYLLRDAQTDFSTTIPPPPGDLSELDNGVSLNRSRNLPIVTVDSGLLLERFAAASGVSTVTLEPRVMYTYIPYRNQSELPLFDTSTPDPNLIELFRPNRYVGLDRIGDANAVTVGMTTEVFASSGTRYLSATLGQSLYLTPPQVSLPGETLGRHSSDLIGEINLSAYRNWNLMMDAAANQTVTRIEQAEVELQYRASGEQVANINYQYRYGVYEQIDTSTAWPITHHLDLYARAVYSLLDRAPIEDFFGFQYRGSCWGMRAVWQRSVTLRNGERDSGFMLQVELIGLSNVGSQVTTFLEQGIRGYSPPGGHPALPMSTP
jgi:LPS-assembly protein